MSQLTYQGSFDKLVAGELAIMGVKEAITRNAEAATDIEYGLGLVRGTNPTIDTIVATADTQSFIGVSGFFQNETGNYIQGADVKVWSKGHIAVVVPDAVTVAAGEAAYVVVAAGADQGKFTNVSTANLATGAVFGSAKENDNLAILSLDLVV